MRLSRAITVVALVSTIAFIGGAPAHAQVPRTELPAVALPEVANGVAVADTGVALVSLYNPQAVGIVATDGTLTTVDIGCSPMAVAISPDGSTGWAVCSTDSHIHVINVKEATHAVADLKLVEAVEIEYSASARRLVIAGYQGQVVIVSATSSGDYSVVKDTKVGGIVSALTLTADGRTGYIADNVGSIAQVSVDTGATQQLQLEASGLSATSLAVSKTGRLIYVAGADLAVSQSDPPSVILAVDPATGKTVQRKPLQTILPGFGAIYLAACHRILYVADGVGVDLGSQSTGLFGIALDEAGGMDKLVPVLDEQVYAGRLDMSPTCTRGAAASTSSSLIRWTAQDPPFAPSLSLSGSLARGRLLLRGFTQGVDAGARVDIFVKAQGKKGATFVKQAKAATVASDGSFTWTGATKAEAVAVYAQSGMVKSRVISLRLR